MTERPLESRDRRRIVAEHAADGRGFGRIRRSCAVAVRDDHADIARSDLGVVKCHRDRAGQTVAVVADREQAGRLRRIASAQHLAR